MATTVFVTIDTEVSMGGAWRDPALDPLSMDTCVYCRRGGREHGVRAIMTILEASGLPGVFFIDTAMAALFGRAAFTDLCQEVLARGHDVQMHLHPGARQYALLRAQGGVHRPPNKTDLLSHYDVDTQAMLIAEGRDLLKTCAGRLPVAFRAGSFAVGTNSFQAMTQAGIYWDFSTNLSCLDTTSPCAARINVPYRMGLVTEFPVTQMIGRSLPGRGWRPLEVNCISGEEMAAALDQLCSGGAAVATIVLHSFGLLKNRVGRWESARPDMVVRRRFQTLCRLLDRRRGDLNVERVSDCAAAPGWAERVVSGPNVWPRTCWRDITLRHVGQAVSLM
ncbi:MAG: hypothetical protein LLG01_19000 [Planctomycetaceae bacterium]|nr:hypothetical protein [Planctomycetaceae bacterium]